ncbi:MAG TPA: TonB-dependent receptor [Nevskiaceae bacterium]|nr:TonB-dependent receptor [Nevskiaceae bacterium]
MTNPAGRGAVLLAAAVLQAGPLHAQEPAPSTIAVQEAAAPQAEGGAAQLDEVTVTVQKRTQNLQKVPAAVGVIRSDTLEQTGSFDAAALEKYTPNIQIDNDPQAPVIGVRGFSTETDNTGFEPSVGLTFDDLALGRPEFIADGFFDMDRIEVLRGTQGTLFGKNTIAGVINFHTVEPDATRSAYLTATGGGHAQQRAEGGATLPLTDWLSSRVAGVWWRKDGDIYNGTLNRYESSLDQKAGRVKLVADAGTGWKLGLSAQRSHTHVLYPPWQFDDASADAMAFARRYDASTEDDPLDGHTNENYPGFVDRNSALYRGIATLTLGNFLGASDVTATAVGGHAAFDFHAPFDVDVSAADLVNTLFDNADQQNTLELRLAGTSGSLLGLGHEVNWVAGIFGLRARLVDEFDTLAGQDLAAFAASSAGLQALGAPRIALLNTLFASVPVTPGVPLNDAVLRPYAQSTTSTALFGEMTWDLTDRLAAVIGARVGRDDKDAHFNVSVVGPGIIATIVGAKAFTADLARRETDFSPKLGLQYQWTRSLFSYVTASRGFKGGGFNATADTDSNLQFEPERARSLEAGIKSEWFDRSLRINADLYRTDVSDLQVVDFVGTSFKVANAAEARLEGIELETRWRPGWTWLSVDASVALSRAYYLSYPNAPPAPEQMGSGVPDPLGLMPAQTQDLTGRTLQHAPRATATLSPAVTLPLLRNYAAMFGVDFSYRGQQYSSGDLDSHSFEAAYTLLGARLVVGPQDLGWSFIVNGSNLANHRGAALVVNNPVYPHTYSAQETIPLRSWSASIQARF